MLVLVKDLHRSKRIFVGMTVSLRLARQLVESAVSMGQIFMPRDHRFSVNNDDFS